MTSAHLIRARLAAYEHHRCTTLSCSEVWILCWFLSGVCTKRQACRGWLYEPPLFRYTIQCAKIRRCDDTGDFTAWPVTAPWQPGRARQTQTLRPRPKFTACLSDRAKVDDVIRGIPVVVNSHDPAGLGLVRHVPTTPVPVA